MISVIICSANKQDLLAVEKNIENTIGVQYELIAFDNGDAGKGICEIYNRGADAARYDILCFMHEDIEFISQHWGKKVIEIFESNKQLGLIGVAGGGYKSVVPSSWYNADLEVNGEFYCSLIQGFKYSGKEEFYDYRNPKNEVLSRVACIDGCWMCTRASIVRNFPFDQQLLHNFHGYDLDFSLSVNQQYHVGVTYEILLKHFSEGNFSDAWLEDTLKVHKKWSHMLPVNTDNLSEKTLKRYERRAFKVFFNRMLDAGMRYSKLRAIVWNAGKSRIFPLRILFKIYLDLYRVRKKRKREGRS